MSALPTKRRDYSDTELDGLSLYMCRALDPNIVIWTGRHAQTLKEYLDARLARNRAETAWNPSYLDGRKPRV